MSSATVDDFDQTAEHARLLAQRYLDESLPKPDWRTALLATCLSCAHGTHMIDEAMEVIDGFPVRPTDPVADAYIRAQATERSLHSQDVLIKWLCDDRDRFTYLDTVMGPDSEAGSLLCCLREAYADCLKDTISTIEVFLEDIEI